MTASENEPPIREFDNRGVLWLLESPQNLADLLQMLSAELAARLDFARAERRTGVGFRSDGKDQIQACVRFGGSAPPSPEDLHG